MKILLLILFSAFLLSCTGNRARSADSKSEHIDSLELITPYHFTSFETDRQQATGYAGFLFTSCDHSNDYAYQKHICKPGFLTGRNDFFEPLN